MRQHQAASLFIEKIIEDQAYVGIVTFSDSASIRKPLTLIDGEESRKALVDALPTTASGGTEICRGLGKGLEVKQQITYRVIIHSFTKVMPQLLFEYHS